VQNEKPVFKNIYKNYTCWFRRTVLAVCWFLHVQLAGHATWVGWIFEVGWNAIFLLACQLIYWFLFWFKWWFGKGYTKSPNKPTGKHNNSQAVITASIWRMTLLHTGTRNGLVRAEQLSYLQGIYSESGCKKRRASLVMEFFYSRY